jgi:hypothetical protein
MPRLLPASRETTAVNATANAAPTSPRQEYERRLAECRAEEERQGRRERGVGRLRVAVLLLAGLLAVLLVMLERKAVVGAAFGASTATVVAVLVVHFRIQRAVLQARWKAGYFRRGLARLDGQWAGHGTQGQRFLDPEHPYAADLDLFGPGSLYERLCTARTAAGEETLARWLLAPAAADEVRERQAAVAELRGLVDLRVDLGLHGGALARGVDFGPLLAWGQQTEPLTSVPLRVGVALLALATATVSVAWLAGAAPSLLLGALLVVQLAVGGALRRPVQAVVGPVERRGGDLLLLHGILARIEGEQFQSPRLQRLVAGLATEGVPPSQRLADLSARIDWLNSRKNGLFAPISVLLLWTTQCAFFLEAWRRATGPALGRWLEVVSEFEALASLATFAYENPDDPFPELTDDCPLLEAEAIGHPLLGPGCVRNDVCLGGTLRLLVISGSNMSGKSTLLRTVGVNAVLALAGATVRARRLRLCPFALGATLRTQDSLQAGRSRFYAEIVRIRQLVDLTRGPRPLLFLLDELLQGTNSHDRLVGARGIVRSLVAAGAVGMITTHDLALTAIADDLGEQARNVHFEDHFEDGVMTFDYTLRPGVVRKSNAVALMRAIGLDV